MQIKKVVIQKRIQDKLNKIEIAEKEYEALFIGYRDGLIAADKIWLENLKKTTTWKEYDVMPRVNNPDRPYTKEYDYYTKEYDLRDKKKQLIKNLAILEALEGDVIEVEKLKTGKNFTIDSIFEDSL